MTFVGQGAIEYGGHHHEFFRLLVSEVSTYFFQGQAGHKFFVNNVNALRVINLNGYFCCVSL